MNPLYNLSACVLVLGALASHGWLASRVQALKGRGWGVAALLVPFLGLGIGAMNFRALRAPTVAVLVCLVGFLVLGRAAASDLEARAARRAAAAAAADGGVPPEEDLGFGD